MERDFGNDSAPVFKNVTIQDVVKMLENLQKDVADVKALVAQIASQIPEPQNPFCPQPPQAPLHHNPHHQLSPPTFPNSHIPNQAPKTQAQNLLNPNPWLTTVNPPKVHPKQSRSNQNPFIQAQVQSKPKGRTFARTFTPLGMSLFEALHFLIQSGHLKLLDPIPLPNPLPQSYKPNQYCAFHRAPGHLTDNCMRLRHSIQDLIDSKKIAPPVIGGPNVIGNPLPNHGAPHPPVINVTHDDSGNPDPSTLITPVLEPKIETGSPKGTETTEPTLSFYTSENVPEWVRRAAEVEEETEEEQTAREEREYREAIRHMHELEETMVEIKWMDPVTLKSTSLPSQPGDWNEEKETGSKYPFGRGRRYEEVMQEERKMIAKQRLEEILMEDWSGPESDDSNEESKVRDDEVILFRGKLAN